MVICYSTRDNVAGVEHLSKALDERTSPAVDSPAAPPAPSCAKDE